MGVIGTKTLGVGAVTAVTDTAEHPLGYRAHDDEGREFLYVVGGGAVSAGAPAKIAAGYVATASGNAGIVVGIACGTLALNKYGWLQTRGLYETAAVDGGVTAGQGLGALTNASGQLVAIADAASATQTLFAIAMADDAANVAPVFIV